MSKQTEMFPRTGESVGESSSGAIFSPCRTWRYQLWRVWDRSLPLILWVLLNPSKADEADNDTTANRGIGFSKQWGFGGLVFCNAFALVSTDRTAIRSHPDPVGIDNLTFILQAEQVTSKTVVAWGNDGKLLGQDRKVLAALDRPAYCLGMNKDGTPKHPLYLSGKTPLIEYEGS